jgi:hypothetical protein
MALVAGRSTESLGVMDAASIKGTILENAAEIERLRARIDETYRHSGDSQRQLDEWRSACAEFHARYEDLAFPGGYERAREQIDAGDPIAVEVGLCFLELRPYFFRSGYMFKDILRRVRRSKLSEEQSGRLAAVLEKRAEWRERKNHDA